jgi:hypothetical protein
MALDISMGFCKECKLLFMSMSYLHLTTASIMADARLAFDVLARDRAQVYLDIGPVLGLIGKQLFGYEAAESPRDLGLRTRRHEELEPRRQPRELAGDDGEQRLLRLLGQLVRARRG